MGVGGWGGWVGVGVGGCGERGGGGIGKLIAVPAHRRHHRHHPERSIPNKSHLFDMMAEANIQPTNCRIVFKKRLWLPREDWASDSFTSLLYHQVSARGDAFFG